MSALGLPDAAQAWLLTYLLHSTLLLGGAALVTVLARKLPVALQESLWRVALLGGLLTATVQTVGSYEPVGGRVPLPPSASAGVPAEAPLRAAPDAPNVRRIPGGLVAEPPPAGPTAVPAAAAPLPWAAILGGLWLAGVALALTRGARARRRLRGRLAARESWAEGPGRALLDGLRARGRVREPVRLTRAAGIGSPVALGIWRREICVPARAAAELTPAQLEVMLAHELAHHVRRDPAWLALGRLLETLFFFQPLNWLAGRRLRETAELLCDAWAVRQTGQGHALAECLTRVAEWMLRPRATLPLPAMAVRGACLERRVRTLLDGDRTAATRPIAPRWRLALAAAALLAVALLAPRIGQAGAATGASRAAPAATDDLAGALDALDEEMAGLDAEIAAALALLAEVPSPPASLAAASAALRRRLEELRAERSALLLSIRPHWEASR